MSTATKKLDSADRIREQVVFEGALGVMTGREIVVGITLSAFGCAAGFFLLPPVSSVLVLVRERAFKKGSSKGGKDRLSLEIIVRVRAEEG